MSLHLHIDEVRLSSKAAGKPFELVGWCLDENSEPAMDLRIRGRDFANKVSRVYRADLADLFPNGRMSGWGGFRAIVDLGFGWNTITLSAGEKVLWHRRIFSWRKVGWNEERTWDFSPVERRSADLGFEPPEIDVVGVFYSRTEFAERWFSALGEASKHIPGLRVFVVEHGQEPVVRDFVDQWSSLLPIEWRHNPGNPGFGAGCNTGASLGSAPYILFLNPDAVLSTEGLRHLLCRAVADTGTSTVGWEAAQRPWEHPKVYHPLTGETEWSSAAAWLVDRKAFEAVDGFDENIFLYAEDVDLSWRLRAKGGRLVYLPDVQADHNSYDEGMEKVGKPLQVEEGARSNLYLRKKYRSGGRAKSPETVNRFLGEQYEVHRPGCSWVPLEEFSECVTIGVRVREVPNGFSRGNWKSFVQRWIGVDATLLWMTGGSPDCADSGGWVFDAESNWVLFPDALAQMVAHAKKEGVMAVQGAGLLLDGERSGDLREIKRFYGKLPDEDPQTGFRPGVLRKVEGQSAKILPKEFWLELEGR